MVTMPEDIKQKLRQLDSLCREAEKVESQLDFIFMSYGIDSDVFKGFGEGSFKTEAFVDIVNCSRDIEENIKDIERVFLHYAKEK